MADDEGLEQDVRGRRHHVRLPRHALIVALTSIAVASIALAPVACKRATSDIAPDPSARPKKDAAPVDDEVDVWSIVVDDIASPFAGAAAPMAVVNKTAKIPCLEDLSTSIPTTKSETLDAFAKVPIEPVRPLATHVATKLVDDSIPIDTPSPGFVALSAVAFDGAHRDALVQVTHIQGKTSRRIVVYHLVRDGDSWRKMEIARCI